MPIRLFSRSLRIGRRRLLGPGLLVAVLLLALVVGRLWRPADPFASFSFDSERHYLVKRVVDGDTLLLEGGVRVRLLGVDTPETKHPDRAAEPLGFEATEFTREHVEGRWVTLRFDRERIDKYRRVLAFVFRDGWFLNEELILAGYSRAETRFPYSTVMKRRFRIAESQAREARRGIWASEE